MIAKRYRAASTAVALLLSYLAIMALIYAVLDRSGGAPLPELDSLAEPALSERPQQPASGQEMAESVVPDIQHYRDRLPGSLSGTDIDGGFLIAEDGSLVISRQTTNLFDYFFSLQGDESETQIYSRMASLIEDSLTSPAKEQALTFLDKFVSYRQAGRALRFEASVLDIPHQQRAERLSQLRREIFGEDVARILFGREEQVVRLDLARYALSQRDDLSADERTARLAEIEAQYPEQVIESRLAAARFRDMHAAISEMQTFGASPEDIHRYRAEQLGEEAAVRLAQLDRERDDFASTLSEFRQYNESISHYSEDTRSVMREEWLSQNALPHEMRRLRAMVKSDSIPDDR